MFSILFSKAQLIVLVAMCICLALLAIVCIINIYKSTKELLGLRKEYKLVNEKHINLLREISSMTAFVSEEISIKEEKEDDKKSKNNKSSKPKTKKEEFDIMKMCNIHSEQSKANKLKNRMLRIKSRQRYLVFSIVKNTIYLVLEILLYIPTGLYFKIIEMVQVFF